MIGPQVTPEAFAALDPDMRLLAAIDTHGISVTCKEEACFTQGKRWYFPRFFALICLFFCFFTLSCPSTFRRAGACPHVLLHA